METISCHSNQSSYPTGIKNITFVEGNVLFKYAQFAASSSLRFLRRRILNFFFENLREFYVALSTNQIKRFGQNLYETWRTTQ